MRCKTCDYPLWTLKGRTCPECGRPFAPSEYEFTANSVRFCCPHCEQSYYGTDDHGHLVPRQFECVSCRTFIRMDEMVLLPADGVVEAQTRPGANPWMNRRERGRTRSLLSVMGMALTSPARLMQLTPVDSSVLPAWGLATMMHLLVAFVAFLPLILLFAGIGIAGGGMGGVGLLVGILLTYVGGAFLGLMIGTVIWGAVTHGLLHITGGAAAGIGRTYQAICYTSPANIFSAIPCIGMYFGWIWWIVSAVLAVKEAQKVSAARASLAVLVMPILGLLTCLGGYAALFATAMTGAAAAGGAGGGVWGPVGSAGQRETQKVTNALVAFSADNAGATPSHAWQLLVGDYLNAWDFISSDTGTTMPDVSIASTGLNSLAVAPKYTVVAAADAAAESLPDNVVAHRVGDYVFTYHGIDLSAADPNLWLVIQSPDPGDASAMPRPVPAFTYVGLADGTVRSYAGGAFLSQLAPQNALRAAAGLPPLPDPATVTHDSPSAPAP